MASNADAVAELKASIKQLHIRLPHGAADSATKAETLTALVDMGFCVWEDMVGADASTLQGCGFRPPVHGLCVRIFAAANMQHRANSALATRPAELPRISDKPAVHLGNISNDQSTAHVPRSLPCPQHIIRAKPVGDEFDARGLGPAAACKKLTSSLASTHVRQDWVAAARTSAILGTCPRSHKSVRSGLRCWYAFAQQVLQRKGQELPPTVDGLLA